MDQAPPPQNPPTAQAGLAGNPTAKFQSGILHMNPAAGMSEQAIMRELDHRERTAEARTDKKFSDFVGEMKAANATLGGKVDTALSDMTGKFTAVQAKVEMLPTRTMINTTVIGTGVAVIAFLAAIVFGALQYGGATFANGLAAKDIAHAAAQEALHGH